MVYYYYYQKHGKDFKETFEDLGDAILKAFEDFEQSKSWPLQISNDEKEVLWTSKGNELRIEESLNELIWKDIDSIIERLKVIY